MIIVPAIDLCWLRQGWRHCLRQGRYDDVTVFDEDPDRPGDRQALAMEGILAAPVVDLEGAGRGAYCQTEMVRAIVTAFGGPVQVGGGVRTREAFEAYRAIGAERVVLGSAAVSDPALVRDLATGSPGRVVVAVDARDGLVAVDGWTRATKVHATELVQSLAGSPLAGVLYTDVARDGMRTGPNVEATAALAASTPVPVIASGGVGELDDLPRASPPAGIAACIVDRALYEHAFTLAEAIAAARGARK